MIQLDIGVADGKDVEALLQHLYHDKPLCSTSTFKQTSRILRAATQFDFPQVRNQALYCLEELYPSRPAPFDCVRWQHLSEAAQLALDCGATKVLPALLYAMVTTLDFDVEENLNGLSSSGPSNIQKEAVPPVLDLNRLCIQLMNRIMEHFAPILFTVPTSSHMECTGVFADHWMNFAIQPALEDSGVYKPLETLKKVQEVNWKSLGLCESCYAEKKLEWEDEADDIWSRMAGWVDVR
ncbi:hypothetical protein K439DRAFT_1627045 [Ramaria rubella]|nr:hypothetical protein K439DRAFT_1627045 [Ramaria rubella]